MEAEAADGETTSAVWLYHQCNQSTHITDGVTDVTSASLQVKLKIIM
jgi:hypothetical protein